ncbi:3-keto-disaccharide hydrolase [Thalassoroseus pseudoceratinae]|uniref:3-keto-disaccharide hydrolase n=1 Tax=Thalassoroseus pseudoceratinae TaxID=2713176 RepID=UPI001421CB62|nr:DUF1080 domain-containing protein [Thalassoroseus pseudoceratinae]
MSDRSRRLLTRVCTTACLVGLLSLQAQAAGKDGVLDPQKADEDFAYQGEYSGRITEDGSKVKLGVQVIALGDGKFRAVGYPGGLPGEGWDGENTVTSEATRNGHSIVFIQGDGPKGVLTKGKLRIETNDGSVMGTLKKVHRNSVTLGEKPPKGAIVLYGGEDDVKNWKNGKVSEDGWLQQGTQSKQTFQDHTLHLEFYLSYMPHARGQARSNSGCYLQGRYEVQILDSFGLSGENNECGGIYTVSQPRINMCYPPLTWQTYDIDFTAPKFDSTGKKTANARMTVRHNGVLIQNDVEIPGPTRAAPNKEDANGGPVFIQNHGNPLRFRNVWVIEK